MTVGDRIAAVMEAKGLKSHLVAKAAGITAATLSNITTGVTKEPTLHVLLAVASVIDEPVCALLGLPAHKPLLDYENERIRQGLDIVYARVLGVQPSKGKTTSMNADPARFAYEEQAVATPNRAVFTDVTELEQREIPVELYKQKHVRRVFKIHGDSMIGNDINDGDLVYVKTGVDVRSAEGKIIVCRVGNNQCVKRLRFAGRRVILSSANVVYPDVIVNEDVDDFEFIGVVVARLESL